MPKKVEHTAPMATQFGLEAVMHGLCSDLEALRAGEITVPDALARAAIAKQICNGFRLYLNGMAILSDRALPAKHAGALEGTPDNG